MSEENIHDETLRSCSVQIDFIKRNQIFLLLICPTFPIILEEDLQIDFVFYLDRSGRGIKMSFDS
jgi:hypothetical protein